LKKNFLITTDAVDMWEIHENNFLLGKWCEFSLFEKEKLPKEINIIKNKYHWSDYKKKEVDYNYLYKVNEYLINVISENLSKINNIEGNKTYWKIILNNWLSEYIVTLFDRWENIRIFFEKNKNHKFYSNYILVNEDKYISKNHVDFIENVQKDEWNHLAYLRIFNFLNIENLTLIKKKIDNKHLEVEKSTKIENISMWKSIYRLIDNLISRFAFRHNQIIFESFRFPKKEYLKICLKNKLIPSQYNNLFNFDTDENDIKKENKRIELKNLILSIDHKDNFIKFLLLNIHKDIPKSYLENFNSIRNKILPLAKNKKTIFSMYSIDVNDNFKIYLAETKKFGSKFIHVQHGGGLGLKMNQFFDFIEKISDERVIWGDPKYSSNPTIKLSPSLPIIKIKKNKPGNLCTIVFVECLKYQRRFNVAPSLEHKVDYFNNLVEFVNGLNPEIKSKIKFRVKKNWGFNSEKKFSEKFGPDHIDKVSNDNSFIKTLLKSKLIISTYPETAFSEAMYSNTPTILIIKSEQWTLQEEAIEILNYLKKNQIAFDNFKEAKNHINKHWNDLDIWWKSKNVQGARELFLKKNFNVNPNWFRQWSDYIYSNRQL